jgi:hypothetical protein
VIGGSCNGLTFNGVYYEGNKTKEAFRLVDSRYVTINSVVMEDGPASSGPPNKDCFVRLQGNTTGTAISRLTGNCGIKKDSHIVLLDGGQHAGVKCEQIATAGEHVPSEDWIGTINGGVNNDGWNDVYT